MSKDDKVIIEAELDRRVLNYYLTWLLLIPPAWVMLILAFTIAMPISLSYSRRYFDHHSMVLLGDRIVFRQGVYNRRELDIPLDRITDISINQGPVMRRFGFYGMTVETAGQTRVQGTAKLDGVSNPHEFREMTLKQRKAVAGTSAAVATAAASSPSDSVATEGAGVLREMRDLLRKIEKNTDPAKKN